MRTISYPNLKGNSKLMQCGFMQEIWKFPFWGVSPSDTQGFLFMGVFTATSCVSKKKKRKKKKGGVNITQANSLKILISSLRACAGFFSLILARFSLLKHTSYTLRRFWPTTVNQAFFKFSLAELWRGCENDFHIMTSFFCATFSLKLTGETAQMHLCNKHRLRKKTLRIPSFKQESSAQIHHLAFKELPLYPVLQLGKRDKQRSGHVHKVTQR